MDESVTMRNPQIEARVASSAYAQARTLLEAEPGISAADLVERLRSNAESLAQQVGDTGPGPVPMPRDPREHGTGGLGLGAAAAEARDRVASPEGDEAAPDDPAH